MKRVFYAFLIFTTFHPDFCFAQSSMNDGSNHIDLVQASQKILLAAKRHEATDSLTAVLNLVSDGELQKQLADDNHKKVFWINLYNAYTQILLYGHPELYQKKSAFFGSRQVHIAGRDLSLDDIEHGILRRSKAKWSLGYFNKLFPSSFEKKHRVDKVDYRIHFSLNCGAKSCPPIAFYRPEQLDKQLDIATKTYLKGESEYDTAVNIIYLPTMMSWFRGDFGGKNKMKELLKKIEVLSPGQDPAVKFKKYDWNLFLENYKPTTDG